MTKAELVSAIAEGADLSRAKAELALNGLLDAVKDALAQGDKVTLTHLGSFNLARRAPRKGRNPRTGKQIEIAARTSVRFSPGSALKRGVSPDSRD